MNSASTVYLRTPFKNLIDERSSSHLVQIYLQYVTVSAKTILIGTFSNTRKTNLKY